MEADVDCHRLTWSSFSSENSKTLYLGYVMLRYVLIYNLGVSFNFHLTFLLLNVCSKTVFTLLSTIFFVLPITRTPDNSNLFSISLEGLSYRESTVFILSKQNCLLIKEPPEHASCSWIFCIFLSSRFFLHNITIIWPYFVFQGNKQMLQLLRDLPWKLNCFKIGLVDTMFSFLVTLKKLISW